MIRPRADHDAMRGKRTAAKDIDDYIAGFPADVQRVLRQMRATIRKAVPGAVETIKYQIPTFTLGGRNVVHFAAFQEHVGLYPAPRGAEEFKAVLSAYEGGKGTVRFPLGEPLPVALITRMAKFLVKRDRARAAAKVRKK